MIWKRVPAELSDFLEEALKSFDYQKKMMFGCPVYFINNNMFAGLHQDNFFIRLSETDREKVLTTYEGIRPFEPMKGRTMKEYGGVLKSPVYPSGIFRKTPGSFVLVCGFVTSINFKGKE